MHRSDGLQMLVSWLLTTKIDEQFKNLWHEYYLYVVCIFEKIDNTIKITFFSSDSNYFRISSLFFSLHKENELKDSEWIVR